MHLIWLALRIIAPGEAIRGVMVETDRFMNEGCCEIPSFPKVISSVPPFSIFLVRGEGMSCFPWLRIPV
jgi:hypothetical protein